MVDPISAISGGMSIAKGTYDFLNFVRGIKGTDVIAALFAEEVNNTKKSRVLTVSRRTLAVLMPVETAGKSKEKRVQTKADYDASLAALCSWSDLDPDALIAHVYRAREEGSRPASQP